MQTNLGITNNQQLMHFKAALSKTYQDFVDEKIQRLMHFEAALPGGELLLLSIAATMGALCLCTH